MSMIIRLFIISLLLPLAAQAQDVYVPEALRDWQEWVLKDKGYRDCPFFFDRSAAQQGDFICAWPGRLELRVGAPGGSFTQAWSVYADEQWLPLPGSIEYWPHAVTVNGRAVEVVARGNVPSVRLGPGDYRLAGSFEWDERPALLNIPSPTGLVALIVDGSQIARPERTGAGIFLGERSQQTEVRDVIQAKVYRLVSDNVPTRLVTQLHIDVAGGVREELFGPILPADFVPLTLRSPLPARLEPDGKLRVQVRPGSWIIELAARGPRAMDALGLSAAGGNLPDSEIWSYQSNDRLRVTVAEGLPPVNPEQVQVPAAWAQLPAFRIEAGESLLVTERSRGMVAAENQLTLRRQMWLDFDGEGFTVSDDIGGKMRTGWRLDMAAPFALMSATEGADNLLITRGSGDAQTGIELRRSNVDVAALARLESRAALKVNGWNARFMGVSTTLHMPPGHKLLVAPGADKAPGSWVNQWRLLDFFLLLIITIGAWRLFGRTAGLVALAALILSFHEPNAPSWLWLNLLIAVALLRVAPPGRLLQSVRAYQAISVVLLALVLVPFVAAQLRIAIYPQLESQYSSPRSYGPGAPPAAVMVDEMYEQSDAASAGRELRMLSSLESPQTDGQARDLVVSKRAEGFSYARYAPNAIVQAGLGKPSWQWNSYLLSWSGPVEAEQTMRLVILPRWAVTLLRCLEVTLLLLFAAILAAEFMQRRFTLPGGLAIGKAQASSLFTVGLLLVAMGASPIAEAQLPDPGLLQELEKRLLEPPACTPRCAEIVAAEVDVEGGAVRMVLSVSAFADVAVPLPGSEQGWRPTAILVDGSAAGQVLRGPGQSLWARLAAGRHEITLSGPLADADSIEITFPTPPRVVEVESDGWFVAGVKDRRLLAGSLQLTRLRREGSAEPSGRWESNRFPAFAEVTRTIRLDLDWSASTTVSRVAPAQGALTLEVPLLDGESVLTEGVVVEDGRALISMRPDQYSVTWSSSLPRTSPLVLSPEPATEWQEIWRVGVGSIWHADFSGVPESENSQPGADDRLAEFFPRAGESLTIDATRPEASAGSTLAFDSVELGVVQGARSSESRLALRYRSTRGAQHVLQLPADAEVSEVRIDGRLEPLRADAGSLTVPILPGEHRIDIGWRTGVDVATQTGTPVVDIGAPASNINLALELPASRWVLATNGPRLGPAVLYWSELAVLLLFAAILGRVRLTPLTTRHWLLLGLGFSTFSWPVLGWVVIWLLVCGARERWQGGDSWWRFNAAQVAVAALTITALIAIVSSLPGGLLGSPDMHVTGNGSMGNSLNWFADRSTTILPTAAAWSLPVWIYKVLILSWALWLSFALLRWLPWVWTCFSSRGYWRSRKGAPAAPEGSK
jgi:hypothetical protein